MGPVANVQLTALDDVGTTLLEAAGRLLAEEGPGALTVRRIAGDAGMSTMNVYSRFGSKHGVVEQLFLHGFRLLAAAMADVPHTDDALADLRTADSAYRRFALEHTTLYSVMFDRAVPHYQPTDSALATGMATLQQLAELLERAMDAGALRRLDPLHAAAIVWSTCHGVISLELKQAGMPIQWDAVYADACENVVRGLAT